MKVLVNVVSVKIASWPDTLKFNFLENGTVVVTGHFVLTLHISSLVALISFYSKPLFGGVGQQTKKGPGVSIALIMSEGERIHTLIIICY